MRRDFHIASQLRTNRESRRIAESQAESIDTARDLLFNIKVSITAIPITAFPVDQRKEAMMQIRNAAEAIKKLRSMLGS